MSKKIFSESEVRSLEKNKYVKRVSNKAITYSFEFKKKFIEEYKQGKLPRSIFEEAGFDIDIIGMKRVETAGKRWRKAYNKDGEVGLYDSRDIASGRPLERELTDSEKIKRLERRINYLEAENELLKKLDKIERGDV